MGFFTESRKISGWLSMATLAFGAACAQGRPATQVTMTPTPLLPSNSQFVPATSDAGPPADSDETTAVLKEDGLKRQEARSVVTAIKVGTAPSGWVKAYEFVDATGAFAAYTYLRQNGSYVKHGVNATEVQTASETVFLSGTSVVRANLKLYPESALAALQQVDAGLPKISGRRALAPLLPTMFPPTGLERDTMVYSLGPVGYKATGGVLPADDLGWDKSAEVAMANYHGKGQLTLLLYPTPQIAGDRGRVLQDDINKAGPKTFGTIKMRRVGPLVGVTSGSLSDAQAIDMVSALKLNQEVTFDKPMPLEFHAEVRKTYTLLQSISIFTGIAVLAAVVLGIFLGGARAGLRVLQGKPAASEPEFLSINLRDKPKGLFSAQKPGDPPGAAS